MTARLTDRQRQKLRILAITLIPTSPEGPSADEAEVATTWIDVMLQERPDLLPGLQRILDDFDDSAPRPYLEALRRRFPVDFSQLTYAVAGSFFKSPAAKTWLDAERLLDEYEDAEPELTAETEALLAPVRRMVPLYRPTAAAMGDRS